MIRIYLAAVDMVPAAIVLLPLFWMLNFACYHRNHWKSILYCLFCLYLSAVFSLVGIPNVTNFRPDVNWNLIPFRGMVNDLKNSFMNIVLFVPLGCFLPLLWTRFRKIGSTLLFGFGLSLTIELLQMLTYRATDVNDLITNTVGAVIGFLLMKAIYGKRSATAEGSGDVYFLVTLSFGVMFFLHPFLSPLFWDKIL